MEPAATSRNVRGSEGDLAEHLPEALLDLRRRLIERSSSAASGRGAGHQSRLTSNDPNAEIILLIVP